MNKFNILVDTREHGKFKKLLKEGLPNLVTEYDMKVGDIMIVGEPSMRNVVIERKTVPDLKASAFRDGRCKEQCWRLKRTCVYSKALYLVEGNVSTRDKLYKSILQTITNICIRDDIPVLRTKNMEDTVNEVIRIRKCMMKYGVTKNMERVDAIDQSNKFQTKGGSTTPQDFYKSILRLIPSVGPILQNAITNKLPTFPVLYNECANNNCQTLSNITYGKRNTKIPITTVAKIRNYVLTL